MAECVCVQAAHKRASRADGAVDEQLAAFAAAAQLARSANCAALDALYRLHSCRLKRLAAVLPQPLLLALVPLLWSPAPPEGGILRAALSRSAPLVATPPELSAANAAAVDPVVAAAVRHCFLPDVSWRMHGSASMCADPSAAADTAADGAGPPPAEVPVNPDSLQVDAAGSQPAPGPATPARRSTRIQSNPNTPNPAKADKRRRPTAAAANQAASAALASTRVDLPGSPAQGCGELSHGAVYSAPLQRLQSAALLLVDASAAMHWCVKVAPGHHRAKRRLAELFLAAGRPELARALLSEVLCSPADLLQFTPEALRPAPAAVAVQPTAKAGYPDVAGVPEVAAGIRPEGGAGKHPCEEVPDEKHAARLSRCIVLYVRACRLSGALREAAAVLRWGLATGWGATVVNLGKLGPAAGGVLLADLAAAAGAAAEVAEAGGPTPRVRKDVLEAAWQVNTLLGGDAAKWGEAERAVEAAQALPEDAQAQLGGPVCAAGLPLARQAHFLSCAKVRPPLLRGSAYPGNGASAVPICMLF